MMNKTKIISRTSALIIATFLLTYIFLISTNPFTKTILMNTHNKNLTQIGPGDRVINDQGKLKILSDFTYFKTKMPTNFDSATVKVKFINPASNQTIKIGYKDQTIWHYNETILDSPLINAVTYPKIGTGPYLYQKNPTYKMVNEFLTQPAKNSTVGVYDFQDDSFLYPQVDIAGYSPATVDTSLSTPMRGRTVLYAYLKNEPFKMSVTKTDLNWYGDPDAVKISVFKQNDKVFDAVIDDDGNTTDNHQPGGPQSVTIKNPGPGLPENGVYKIVIDSTGDSLITNITTNLHKLSFEGPLYIANNKEVYGKAIVATAPTALYTDAQQVSATTDHSYANVINVGTAPLKLPVIGNTYTAATNAAQTPITLPKSDNTINGNGYFAFSPDQLFSPSPYKVLNISKPEDIAKCDYIITNYPGPPKQEGEWKVAERTFDLSDAVIQKGQLSWSINAPGLKDNSATIDIKDIEVTMTKRGWIK